MFYIDLPRFYVSVVGKQLTKWYSKLSLQYPNKIRIIKFIHRISIQFNPKMILRIYSFLKLKPINKYNFHRGTRIIHPEYFKLYKIV